MTAPIPGSPEWAAICACGCGESTPIAKRTRANRGWVKGQPVRFKHGHGGGRRAVAIPDRFWQRVDRRGPGECWPWLGAHSGPMGYGRVAEGKNADGAHRVAYKLAYGAIPDGTLVRHACDNPPCCNPAHLLVGTPADNARDRVERDRSPKGEQVPSHVLTAPDVEYIRRHSDELSVSSLARQFGVARSTVRRAREGRTWKHLESA